ncbi:hypothetical protein VP01_3046g1 [Puccinia sorghi]|uniref:Uncharacterized protein n=1 Tax=Puccinia sorghi TaxID=27349 RepID=A0A0L6UZY4_9BASI|nr:hypothetical protein VP01_3046g1 [Puccinia sorghi]
MILRLQNRNTHTESDMIKAKKEERVEISTSLVVSNVDSQLLRELHRWNLHNFSNKVKYLQENLFFLTSRTNCFGPSWGSLGRKTVVAIREVSSWTIWTKLRGLRGSVNWGNAERSRDQWQVDLQRNFRGKVNFWVSKTEKADTVDSNILTIFTIIYLIFPPKTNRGNISVLICAVFLSTEAKLEICGRISHISIVNSSLLADKNTLLTHSSVKVLCLLLQLPKTLSKARHNSEFPFISFMKFYHIWGLSNGALVIHASFWCGLASRPLFCRTKKVLKV